MHEKPGKPFQFSLASLFVVMVLAAITAWIIGLDPWLALALVPCVIAPLLLCAWMAILTGVAAGMCRAGEALYRLLKNR